MKLVNTHKLIAVFILSFLFIKASITQVWTLQQCIDSAEVYNKNMQIEGNNIALGEEKQKEAKANLIPKLIANADYKYFTNLPYQLMPLSTFNPTAPEGQFKEAQFGVPHNISANLQLAIPLYNPQIYGGIEKTKIASEMTALQYEKSKEQIYFEIANLYYNTQILQEQLIYLDSNLVNATKLHENLKLLKEHLLVKGTDVEKIALQVAQLNTQKSILSSKFEQVINTLKFAIGLPNNQTFQIESKIIFDEEINSVNKNSLDYKMIETQKKLLKSELKTIQQSRFLPNINLMASYGTSGFGYDKKPNSFLKFYPIGFAALQVSYPFFNGTISLRKAKQKQIELSNNDLKLQLINEQNTLLIDNAHLQRNSTLLSITTSKQQIKLAENIYNNTILQQKQGLASITDILLADSALREAQQNNISAIIDYLKADLELKKLSGNL